MAIFSLEELRETEVYKSALPEQKEKLEKQYIERFGDAYQKYREARNITASDEFKNLPLEKKIVESKKAQALAREIELEFERKRLGRDRPVYPYQSHQEDQDRIKLEFERSRPEFERLRDLYQKLQEDGKITASFEFMDGPLEKKIAREVELLLKRKILEGGQPAQGVTAVDRLAADQVVPVRGWEDPVNWFAGITGGARAALWRAGGSALPNIAAGEVVETLPQILATETVAEVGQALGEMAAEKLGTPAAGPALALLAHMGGHATASQLFRGLQRMGIEDSTAARLARDTIQKVKKDPELAKTAQNLYESKLLKKFKGDLKSKAMLDPRQVTAVEDPKTGKIITDHVDLSAAKKISGEKALERVDSVNRVIEQNKEFQELAKKTVAKYIADEGAPPSGGDSSTGSSEPLVAVAAPFRYRELAKQINPGSRRVESPRESPSVASGEYFPNPADFAKTVDAMAPKKSSGERVRIKDTLQMGLAAMRDKVAELKLDQRLKESASKFAENIDADTAKKIDQTFSKGQNVYKNAKTKAQETASRYIDKSKIREVISNFTKYEYGKDPQYITARDLANNMSGRVINDARILVKRGRFLASKYNLSHQDIDDLLRGKSTREDLPEEIVNIAKSLRKMIDGLGVDREAYKLLERSSREAGEGTYLPRLYAAFEHPEYFDFGNAKENLLDPAAEAYAKRFGVSVADAKEHLGRLLDDALAASARSDEYHPEWLSLKRSIKRQNLPDEVRVLFGEISDPFYLAYRGVKDQAMDLQHAMVFDYISRNDNLFSFQEKPGWVKLSKKLDEYNITGKTRDRFGAIANGYVPEHLAQELLAETPKPSEWRKAWDLHMALWKKMMVPMSPRTVFRNIISDSMMKYIAGMSYRDQVKYMKTGWNEYMRGSRQGKKSLDYQLAERLGLFEGTFLSSDRGILEESLIPERLYSGQSEPVYFDTKLKTRNPVLQMMHMANRFVDKAGSKYPKMEGLGVGEKASQFYSDWENASKFSMFKYLMENGLPVSRSDVKRLQKTQPGIAGRIDEIYLKQIMKNKQVTPEQAVEYINRFLFDYSKLPKHLQTARGTTHPFIAYPYLASKALAYALQEHPDRVMFMLLQLGLLTKVIEESTGTDISVGDLMPYGHMWDGGNDNNPVPGIFRPLIPSGPAVLPAELLTGHSARTHWGIDNPVEHVVKSELPSIATYHGKDLVEAAKSGDPGEQLRAVLNSIFGIKVKPQRQE
jgi:hypothetical protein